MEASGCWRLLLRQTEWKATFHMSSPTQARRGEEKGGEEKGQREVRLQESSVIASAGRRSARLQPPTHTTSLLELLQRSVNPLLAGLTRWLRRRRQAEGIVHPRRLGGARAGDNRSRATAARGRTRSTSSQDIAAFTRSIVHKDAERPYRRRNDQPDPPHPRPPKKPRRRRRDAAAPDRHAATRCYSGEDLELCAIPPDPARRRRTFVHPRTAASAARAKTLYRRECTPAGSGTHCRQTRSIRRLIGGSA